MGNPYNSPCSYFVVYVYEIPGSVDHTGLLKVGDTSFRSSRKASEFPVNCPELRTVAKQRIAQHTNTAGVRCVLHHAELAVRYVDNSGEKVLSYFRDHDVHDVLEKSGFKHVKIPGTTGREWYRTDLDTIKNAIAAVKDGRISLDSSELKKPDPFRFRDEQESAVVQTLARFKKHNDMLWDAKMRFGKTPTALEVVRRGGFRKTIIITHRPVVGSSWEEDFKKIFPGNKDPYVYVDKTKVVAKGYEAKDEADKKSTLKGYDKLGKHFIYFASIQDLRGSKRVGGDFMKNDAVFDMAWDLVIVDEAHEGTQTDLGKKVSAELIKNNKNAKVLSLSGTPFNILGAYDDDAVFVWDYTMEQKTKAEWAEKHPDEPNPYAVLPHMNIFTFDLSSELKGYAEEDLEGKAFNFAEFFRTWTGDKDADGRTMPKGVKKGDFIHAEDVRKFLDLLSKPSTTSHYPFSTEEYCDYFRHSLWMVPGVAAAKALSEMIHNHPCYKAVGVANVAGEGDDYEEEHADDALELVRSVIKRYSRSITLSCGKLTTGVTVPEWTAVLMVSGSVHTAAASYMQTIFRVQSPWVHDGKVKEECYVFDFAPDRALTVLAETAQLSKRISRDKDKESEGRRALGEFLNFCPVISLEGGKSRQFEVNEMMRRLKHVFVMRAIRNGFDDPSIYNNEKLMKLGKLDIKKFNDLERIVGKTKQTEATNEVTINDLGYDQAEFEKRKKEKEKKLKRELTPEEEEALRKRREEQKMRRDAISILRAISIRMPMLIYGADVPVDEKITIERFVKLVDAKSWEEFMPKGVTKERFADFIEYYDRDVFEEAGIQIRKLAKSAEKLPPGQRVQQIVRIFGYFKNPDKETVLTPWRVVNMHLSDTLGGWCFFNADFDAAKPLDEPRFVDRGEVTDKVFKPSTKILEINSKSGLYPLYVAYSVYRRKCGELSEAEIEPNAREKKWRETVRDNVFVICKTPMAASITRRTLVGYSTAAVNAIYVDNLIDTLKSAPEKFVKKIAKGNFWKREDEEMKFDAVVGNPPYQSITGGGSAKVVAATQAVPIFNRFVESAVMLVPNYISMIIPARWYSGGIGLNEFRNAMLHDKRIGKLFDFVDSRDCFTTADIAGGLCYFLWDANKPKPLCEVTNVLKTTRVTLSRSLDAFGDIFIRNNKAFSIIEKVKKRATSFVASSVSPIDVFGFPSKARGETTSFPGAVSLIHSQGTGYIKRSDVKKNADMIDKYKVTIGILVPCNGEVGIDPKKGYKSITTPRILKPNEVTTFSYLVLGAFKTKNEASNFKKFMLCKFPRYMLRLTFSSMHISKQNFILVPAVDFKKEWTDKSLYDYFGLTDNERNEIEETMRPMED